MFLFPFRVLGQTRALETGGCNVSLPLLQMDTQHHYGTYRAEHTEEDIGGAKKAACSINVIFCSFAISQPAFAFASIR